MPEFLRSAISFSIMAAISAGAAAEPPQMAKSLFCRNGPGVGTSWTNGEPITSPSRSDIAFTISELNVKNGTARLSGAAGSSLIKMVLSRAGVTFLESLPTGGIIITTVYASTDPAERQYISVDTRHNSIFGEPVVTQFFGRCTGEF